MCYVLSKFRALLARLTSTTHALLYAVCVPHIVCVCVGIVGLILSQLGFREDDDVDEATSRPRHRGTSSSLLNLARVWFCLVFATRTAWCRYASSLLLPQLRAVLLELKCARSCQLCCAMCMHACKHAKRQRVFTPDTQRTVSATATQNLSHLLRICVCVCLCRCGGCCSVRVHRFVSLVDVVVVAGVVVADGVCEERVFIIWSSSLQTSSAAPAPLVRSFALRLCTHNSWRSTTAHYYDEYKNPIRRIVLMARRVEETTSYTNV